MTADQFTVYRCPECGKRYIEPSLCRATRECRAVEPHGAMTVPVPVVPREDHDRLRAALERIAAQYEHGNARKYEHRAWELSELARSALHGEEPVRPSP